MEKVDLKDSAPLVSVCIPAYNCEKYIQQTINCLCAQNYPNLELILVNDGSTDQTLTIAQSINDHRLHVINVSNGGAAKARNIAYRHAKGEYIIFFDADDYIEPTFISKQVNKLNNRNNIVVLSGWGRFYNDDLNGFKADYTPEGEMTFKQWIKLYWYNGNPMTNPGRAIIPRALMQQAGLWNETLSLNDDLEFFTRLFIQSGKIVFNPTAMLYYRSGINGLSTIKTTTGLYSLFHAIDLSVNHVLTAYKDQTLFKGCANMWQLFIYNLFPLYPELVKMATQKVRQLKGSDLKFPSGGYTRVVTFIIGWKNTKKLKNILHII